MITLNSRRLLCVCLCPLATASSGFTGATQASENLMETLVVTSTREARNKSELAESVGIIDEKTLNFVAPAHPAEVLNRVAGVHINNLGGEGHMSSIRQPISTAGVYLFLEDGIPTRPTGFFNHNGLYEVNISQGSKLEVTKGPGSALYGSDAIGGVINSITKPAPKQSEADINLEVGQPGWRRALASIGTGINEQHAIRADLNLTDSSGYRDDSDYSRSSSNIRLDSQLSAQLSAKTVLAYSKIEQSGVSSLEADNFENDPTVNFFQGDVGFRKVDALRLSSELNYHLNDEQLLTITPFYRDNSMTMMPSWMVTYDPNLRDYEFQSYGALIKFRQNFLDGKGLIIAGMDTDYTPSSYREQDISMITDGDFYTGYNSTGAEHYNFNAQQTSASPYLHTEWQLAGRWRLQIGARYDYFQVKYQDKLSEQVADNKHLRPEAQTLSFNELSPKAGLVYQYRDAHNAYLSYRHAFRAPTVGNLFRPGSSLNSEQLQPVSSDSIELGLRGQWLEKKSDASASNRAIQYELALYDMTTRNDIVSHVSNGDRISSNAGKTRHRGLEASIAGKLSPSLSYSLAWTVTKQQYEDYSYVFGQFVPGKGYVSETRNYSGFDVGKAPKTLGNFSLTYHPTQLPGLRVETEVEQVGRYFTDETNTAQYAGHRLFNLRANYALSPQIEIYTRVMNLTDERYSTYTSNPVGDSDIDYRPGLPRSAYLGARLAF